jgi:hypothetical protein
MVIRWHSAESAEKDLRCAARRRQHAAAGAVAQEVAHLQRIAQQQHGNQRPPADAHGMNAYLQQCAYARVAGCTVQVLCPERISRMRRAVCGAVADYPHILPLGAVVVVDGHPAGAAHAMAAEVAMLLRSITLQQKVICVAYVTVVILRNEAYATCVRATQSNSQQCLTQMSSAAGVNQAAASCAAG